MNASGRVQEQDEEHNDCCRRSYSRPGGFDRGASFRNEDREEEVVGAWEEVETCIDTMKDPSKSYRRTALVDMKMAEPNT